MSENEFWGNREEHHGEMDECIWWWYGVYVNSMSEGGMKWVWGYVCLIRVCWVWYRVIVCVSLNGDVVSLNEKVIW